MRKQKTFFKLFIVLSFFLVVSLEASEDSLVSLQDSFNRISREIYPSIVSITRLPANSPDEYVSRLFGYRTQETEAIFPNTIQRGVGVGSGIIVHEDGYILTNYHLVDGAPDKEVSVRLTDGREYRGYVLGADSKYDLALVKIHEENLKAVTLADSDEIDVGDWAIAVGNPYGFIFEDAQPTITVGVVSALNRSLPGIAGEARSFRNLIQTDAAINLGNSGGALVNIKGEVMGINAALVSTTGGNQGIGFAIPSNHCLDLLAQFIHGKKLKYGWIGVEAQNMNPDLANYFGLSPDYGIVVRRVIQGGPASKARIKDGDVLTTFGGEVIRDIDTLLGFIEDSEIGEMVEIGFFRRGRPGTLLLKIGTNPDSPQDFSKIDLYFWRGIRPEEITEVLSSRYVLTYEQGVVITDITIGSPGEEAGLIEGEVIVKVGNKRILSIAEFFEAVDPIEDEIDVLFKTNRGFFVVRGYSNENG